MSRTSHAADTSFVMRLLTREPPESFDAACRFLVDASEPVQVDDLVLAEAYFALQFHFGYSKGDALLALRQLCEHSQIAPPPYALEILSEPGLATAQPGFVDRLIHARALAKDCRLVTFEKASAKLDETDVLE